MVPVGIFDRIKHGPSKNQTINERYALFGVFAKKLRKATVGVMTVRDFHQTNFRENPNLGFLLKLIHIFQFGLKSDKNYTDFTW